MNKVIVRAIERLIWLLAGPLLLIGLVHTAPALAQSVPPVRRTIDDNGVDLIRGTFNVAQTDVSIGPAFPRGLSFTRSEFGTDWRQTKLATINQSGSTVYVTLFGASDSFTVSGSTYTPTEGNGSSLTKAGAFWTYTNRNGVVATFQNNSAFRQFFEADLARATQIAYPDGSKLTFTYKVVDYCPAGYEQGVCQGEIYYAIRLQSWNNSFGYQLKFTYATNTLTDTTYDAWNRYTSVKAINNGVEYCNPAADSCTFVNSWPTATYALAGSQLTVTDAASRATRYTFGTGGRVSAIKRPGAASDNVVVSYDGSNLVQSVAADGVITTYAYATVGTTRTTTITDPNAGSRVVVGDTATFLVASDRDELSRTTSFLHDASGRVTRMIAPEGNYTAYTYDARGNVTETRSVSKTPGTPADIVATTSFPASCTNAKTCNKPTSSTDPKGNVTDFTYDAGHGGILTSTAPAMPNSIRPQTRTSYTSLQAYYKLTGSSIVASGVPTYLVTQTAACQTTASCTGAADETKTTISYGPQVAGTASNLNPVSATAGSGNGALSVTASASYDNVGNRLTVDGPLAGVDDTTRWRFDAVRQAVGVIGPDPDGGGSRKHLAVRTTYNLDGQVTKAERGTVTSQSDPAWAAFAPAETVDTTYDANARRIKDTLSAGGSTHAAVQYSYDALARLDCTAQRMNAAVFGSLPASACTLGTQGTFGPDRITKNTYSAASQVITVTEGYATAGARYAIQYGYTTNGLPTYLVDAEGNWSAREYDGFDRLLRAYYPSKTVPGNVDWTDFEQYGYDANSNVTSRRLRDAQTIGFTYDSLNRRLTSDNSGFYNDVLYSYDNLGRLTNVCNNSADANCAANGWNVTTAFDALSRPTSQTRGVVGSLRTLSYQWDAASRRTRVTHPDGFYASYDYDTVNGVTHIRENGAVSGVGVLATYAYDDLQRRTSVTRGNGTVTSYGFDAVSRLNSLIQNLASTANDNTDTFTHTPASQIATFTRSNDAVYSWRGAFNSTVGYADNGLNQYTTVGGGALGYDARGNLTSAPGGWSYNYDVFGRMDVGSQAGVTTNLNYDGLDRIRHLTTGAATTEFQYDGDALALEYVYPTSTVARRYVHGPGVDEPIVWYEGSGTTGRRFLHADARGSIIAASDSSGNSIATYTYGPYGEPNGWTGSRFRYTGQIMIPELQLYHYKARAYSPALGRFMQTDPIGYAEGMNLYAYVGNDPVNMSDPLGLAEKENTCRASEGDAASKAHACPPQNANEGKDEKSGEIVVLGRRYPCNSCSSRASFALELQLKELAQKLNSLGYTRDQIHNVVGRIVARANKNNANRICLDSKGTSVEGGEQSGLVFSFFGAAEGYLVGGGGVQGLSFITTGGQSGSFVSAESGIGAGGSAGVGFGITRNLASFAGDYTVFGFGGRRASANIVTVNGRLAGISIVVGPSFGLGGASSGHVSTGTTTIFNSNIPSC